MDAFLVSALLRADAALASDATYTQDWWPPSYVVRYRLLSIG